MSTMRNGLKVLAFACAAIAVACLFVSEDPHSQKTDVEAWNEGVGYYNAGDATNALKTLRPLMLSRTHGARAAEVVAKLEHERGNVEEAAAAAQVALRANPGDERAQRNFTRAVDGLPEIRETKHINEVLKAAEGKDPGSMMLASTYDARDLMAQAGGYATNSPARIVALCDALSERAKRLSDSWLPVKEAICRSVTNEEQAATIVMQVDQAREKTRRAARQLADLDAEAYATLSDVEHDFTRFLKLTALPPAAIGEDLVAQSNAWLDAEAFNGRSWQQDALDYTRSFRAKFPSWARAYEQQAQSDTNRPPFTAEDQAKISALATELEKLQMECVEKPVPPEQERALDLVRQIQELLPKDNSGQGGGSQGQNQQNQQNQQNRQSDQGQNQQNQDQPPEQKNEGEDSRNEDDSGEQNEESAAGEEEPSDDDKEIDALLRRAQERNDEHEADKRARMRKAPLPPNERDW